MSRPNEKYGLFARGIRRHHGAKRWLAIGLVLIVVVLPITVGIVAAIVRLITRL